MDIADKHPLIPRWIKFMPELVSALRTGREKSICNWLCISKRVLSYGSLRDFHARAKFRISRASPLVLQTKWRNISISLKLHETHESKYSYNSWYYFGFQDFVELTKQLNHWSKKILRATRMFKLSYFSIERGQSIHSSYLRNLYHLYWGTPTTANIQDTSQTFLVSW